MKNNQNKDNINFVQCVIKFIMKVNSSIQKYVNIKYYLDLLVIMLIVYKEWKKFVQK